MHTAYVAVATVLLGAALVTASPTLPPHTFSAGTGGYSALPVDGYITSAKFKSPLGVSFDAANDRLVIADSTGNNVRAMSASLQVTTLAGSTNAYSGYVNAVGTAARFYAPFGCAVTSTGVVFISEAYAHRIRKVALDGTVTLHAGSINANNMYGNSGDVDGSATNARFNGPNHIALSQTTLFVADRYSHKIRAVATADGTTSTLAGTGSSGAVDGTGTAASFYSPMGVSVYASATVYVADRYNNKIRKVDIASRIVTTLAGTGSWGATDSTTGTMAAFADPSDVAVDGDENVFVVNSGGASIRIVTSTGATTTVSTLPTNSVIGIAVAPGGSVYVSDQGTNQVYAFINNGTTAAPATTAAPTAVVATTAAATTSAPTSSTATPAVASPPTTSTPQTPSPPPVNTPGGSSSSASTALVGAVIAVCIAVAL
jgi:DNA-binding beta-propeller fold protein YncE